LDSTPLPRDATPEQAATYAAKQSVKRTGIGNPKKAEDDAAKRASDAAQKAGLKPMERALALGRDTAKKVVAAAAEVERKKLVTPVFTASAEERRAVQQTQGRPYNKISGGLELSNCTSLVTQKIGQFLEKNRKKLQAWVVRLVNVIQELIVFMQDKIDSFLLKAQLLMDTTLSMLEKVLSIDINFSGKLGFENSLMKCAWSVDFGIKLDLLGFFLKYLSTTFSTIGLPLRKLLGLLQDFMTNIFCIPIRLFESLLGGTSALMGKIGCTIKDFRLPVEIEQLLQLVHGTFALRGLVLRAGTSEWFDMINKLKMQPDEFARLSQFASICQTPTLSATINALSNLSLTNVPLAINTLVEDVMEFSPI